MATPTWLESVFVIASSLCAKALSIDYISIISSLPVLSDSTSKPILNGPALETVTIQPAPSKGRPHYSKSKTHGLAGKDSFVRRLCQTFTTTHAPVSCKTQKIVFVTLLAQLAHITR